MVFGNWRDVLLAIGALILPSCASVGERAWVDLKPESMGSGPILS